MEAARLAAQFNERKHVWVPDEKDGYLAGWVQSENGDMGTIVLAASNETRQVPLYSLSKMNPPKWDRAPDVADLTFLNEASVLQNLRLRFGSGAIYTYSGLFLVAINPYQSLPLYSDSIIQQYRNKRRDEAPPHIYAIAERAWINMGEARENQSILVTGESGAGKTENTKKVIQYLAAIATDVQPPTPALTPTLSFMSMPATGLSRGHSLRRKNTGSPSGFTSQTLSAKDRLGLLERQILQANPILEAFGNAQTQRNNNSSRFGKFVRITFAPDGSIAGASIDWYLLEKSRVVVRSEAERSFHVFYSLMAGGGPLKDALLLRGGVEDYEYLNKSRREVDGINDREEWSALKSALETVGFTSTEQLNLFRIVAAILHIGNITVTATRGDDAVMQDPSQAERVCYLLGIPATEFIRSILRPRTLAGREWVSQARNKQQALDELSSLCKTLYEKSFGQLVDRLNQALDRPSSKSTFIGVLDIAGFEIFETNAYEQLLINYTNEKLQQFFNHHMFVLEQEEYAREGIQWDYVNFGLDLQPTIDLIESNGPTIGVLSCLDEECIMPKATDLTFTAKMNHMWYSLEPQNPDDVHPGREKYAPSRFEQGFIIQHYAGDVEYRTDGWLEKNKDPLNDNITRVLASSSEPYVAGLFADYEPVINGAGTLSAFTAGVGKRRGLKKGAFRTVAQRHKEQLASLMTQLQATQPHFVRCIVPNSLKRPGRIDVPLVLDQLRCNGVLEGIRIARLGYPNRLPFAEFRQRYEVITPGVIPQGYVDGRKACLRMVDALQLDTSTFKVGTSKIFFKAGVLAELEERRDTLLYDIFSRLQAVARKWTARRQMKKVLNRTVAVRTIQRNARVYGELRDWPWWQLYSKVRPLLAATRNDDELRKKETELALIKERAERDQIERHNLEALKMVLETEKRRIEDDLIAERALALDKSTLLERSKTRESELEEEVDALHNDLDLLDSQLDRAMKMQHDTEEKYESLRLAFDEAAEHLVRMESEQADQAASEHILRQQLDGARADVDTFRLDRDELQKLSEELRALASEREEDLVRARERMDMVQVEMQGKLHAETKTRELFEARANTLSADLRRAKADLAEMARTATEYSTLVQKREEEISCLEGELAALHVEQAQGEKEAAELQSKIENLTAEIGACHLDRERGLAAQTSLQDELDALRAVLHTKSNEATRRSEVHRSRELELVQLRDQNSNFQADLETARQLAVDIQSKLKVDLESSLKDYSALQASHTSLLARERDCHARLGHAQSALSEAEKSKRTLESEVQSLRTRQSDSEENLADARKHSQVLDRKLAAAHVRYQDFEDTVLQIERDRSIRDRQLETTRKQLETETTKCAELEHLASNQKVELSKLKDRVVKLDRELHKTLDNLKARDWEVKQLTSRQDTKIVEVVHAHVHVLEEAKRVTDGQLREAQEELSKNATYIRSLENAKSRLVGDIEDVSREIEQEKLEIRTKAMGVKIQEERVAQALLDVRKEKQARDAAELRSHRLEMDLKSTQSRAEELLHELRASKESKLTLERDLSRLAEETQDSSATMQREHESRVKELERQLADKEVSSLTLSVAKRIKDRVDHQHAEIRRLILADGPRDDTFNSRLLKELQLVDDAFQTVLPTHAGLHGDVQTVNEVTTTTSSTPRSHVHADSRSETDKTLHNQTHTLQQQVQLLELQMVTSDRVRRHLEMTVRDMSVDLEHSDGSLQSLKRHRARLSKENARLQELLKDETEARMNATTAQVDGLQEFRAKLEATVSMEKESYTRLEESHKAVLAQHRSLTTEAEEQRAKVRQLSHERKQFQAAIKVMQERIEEETLAKMAENNAKRETQAQLAELQISSTASSTTNEGFRTAIDAYKAKVESYRSQFEQAEIATAKASRSEAFARRALLDLQKTHSDSLAQHKAAHDRLLIAESKTRDLEAKLEEGGQDSSDMGVMQKRLAEALDDERSQHKKDLEERQFTADQTRKKYQAELAHLSEELQSQRDAMTRLREDNRKIRSDYDELTLRFDEEVYNGSAWKNDKARMVTKVKDITDAYEASNAASEQRQTQIIALHTQVRELRGVLDDAETDRALLQKARRSLQADLDTLKLDTVETSKLASDLQIQKLQLRTHDLERSLAEQQDRASMASERVKKAEAYNSECQAQLSEVRANNSALDVVNAKLEKQVKDLNVRLVDLETKSMSQTATPRTPASSRRLEDIAIQLKEGTSRIRADANTQSAEAEHQRARWAEERKAYEAQIGTLRQTMDSMQTNEGDLQRAKRRAEREVVDFKVKNVNLEREVERLKNRLDRPSTSDSRSQATAHSHSPRK